MSHFKAMGRLFTLLGLALFSLFQPAESREILDPASFVRAVISRHPSVQKADHLIEAAEFGSKLSGLQPNPTLTIAGTIGDAGESANALTQRLEISGQPKLRKSIAQLTLEAAKLTRESTCRKVGIQAYRAWLQYWKNAQLSELLRLRCDLAKEMERAAKRRFELGEISENEALRVELSLAQADTDWWQAEANLQSSRTELELLLGSPEQSPSFTLAEPKKLLPPQELPQLLSSVGNHPDIQKLELQEQALQLGADLISKERSPQLAFSLYRSQLYQTSSVEQGVQLSLSWPLFDWGSIRNRSEQQKSRAAALRASLQEQLLQNRRKVARAWSGLSAANRKRDTLERQAARYQELSREAKIGYDIGLLSLTDLLQTESSYRQAAASLIKVKAEILELELQLLGLTGLPLPKNFSLEDS